MQIKAERERERERERRLGNNLLLKTNLLFLGSGISNLGLEYSFSRILSVDFPVTYSPYTIKRNWKLKLLGFQPEIRIWAKEQLSGHFAGLHAHVVFFNLAVDNRYRYQDAGGKNPLNGIGLTYGYVLRGKNKMDKWRLEFAVGAGYAQIEYDVFYNVPNGASSNKANKNYWGITKAGISLSYNLISKKP